MKAKSECLEILDEKALSDGNSDLVCFEWRYFYFGPENGTKAPQKTQSDKDLNIVGFVYLFPYCPLHIETQITLFVIVEDFLSIKVLIDSAQGF